MKAIVKAFTLLAKYLGRDINSIRVKSHVGVANGDHIFIVDNNLYRVDLVLEKVSKV